MQRNVWMVPVMMLAIVAVMLSPRPVLAYDDEQLAEVKAGVDELRTEMASLRAMIEGLTASIEKSNSGMARMERKLTTLDGKVTAMQRATAQKPAPRPVDDTVYDIKTGNSPYLGPKDAPVTIVEFSDLQCPFCIREVPQLKKVMADYPGKVKIVFKHFPLSMHKKAPAAHAACALAQEQKGIPGFWEMHDKIIADYKNVEKDTLLKYAREMGLNESRFEEVIGDDAKMQQLYAADIAEARKCGVRGTPSIYINGKKLAGRRTPENYKTTIDGYLKAAAGKK